MALNHDLRLHEEILLLALKNERGTPSGSMYTYALAGAVLAELLLEGRARPVARRRGKPLLEATGSSLLGDPVLDAAIRRLRSARRRATLSTWVQRLARRDTVRATATRLVRRGVLRTQEKRVMILFSRTVYPELDPVPERRLIERIREAVLGAGPVDGRTAALVSLAHAAGLLRPVFDRKTLKANKARLAHLAEGDVAAAAAREAIQAVQAAILAATAAASGAHVAAT